MTAANGAQPTLATDDETPPMAVARAVYAADMEVGDILFDDLADDERSALISYADDYLTVYTAWLKNHGFRLIPPGAIVRPTCDEEANAMLHSVKKLILPPGTH
jgi:hypothetical protein